MYEIYYKIRTQGKKHVIYTRKNVYTESKKETKRKRIKQCQKNNNKKRKNECNTLLFTY